MKKDERDFAKRITAVNPLLAPDPQNRSMRKRLTERPGGKSPATLKRYLKRIKEAGTILSLQKKVRKDRGTLIAFSPGLLAEAIRLREEEPKRITRMILEHLKSNPDFSVEAQTVALSTLARHLRQRNKTRRAIKKETKGYRRFERPFPGNMWQFDYTDGIHLPDPRDPSKRRKTQICVGIDDHSRLCVAARAYWRGNWPSLEDCTRHSFATWSLPQQIFVDNGKVFCCEDYERILSELNVGLIHRTPHYPEGGGKIEAIIGTLQEEIFPELKNAGIETLDEFNDILAEWAYGYNRRKHTQTEQVPLERWQADMSRLRPIDPARLAEAFWWRREPKVTKTGLLSVNGVEYELDLALAGQKVEARYDPFDPSGTVRIVDANGKLWGAYRPRAAFPADNGRGRGTPDKREHVPLASAKGFAARLGAKQRGRSVSAPVISSDATHPELAGANQLIHLVASYLLRPELTPSERQALVNCARTLVVVRLDLAESAMRRLVERAGRDLHIGRYIAAITEAHKENLA